MFVAGVDLDEAAGTGVAAAAGVLSTVASIPGSVLSDEALAAALLELETARRFLDGAVLAWLGELDRRGVTEVLFGQRTTAWLAHEAKLPRSVAAGRVRTARKVTGELESIGEALREGLVGFDHARVLADAANPRNVDELAGVTGELVDAAQVASFDRWQSEVRGLAELLDADGGHDPAGDVAEPRLSVNRVGEVTVVNGQLTGEGALVSQAALDQVADELFRAYSRDAELTGDPVPGRSRLLAEAFVELCRRGLAIEAGSSRAPRAEATVVLNAAEPDRVTDESGCQLVDTSVLLCDAVLWPIVTSFDGLPLAMGRSQRFATPHQVRAVNLRDGGCVFPGCDAPAAWTDTHHADPWGHDGHTDTDRMCGLCRFHHRLAHRPGWQVDLDPDGWTRWTRPDGTTFWGQRHQRQRHSPMHGAPPDTENASTGSGSGNDNTGPPPDN
jgi:hypothetical protein